MTNLLARAINCSDGDQAAKIIQDAVGIESDDVANYWLPANLAGDREQHARTIGEWLHTEARFLATSGHERELDGGMPRRVQTKLKCSGSGGSKPITMSSALSSPLSPL
jgi:hypothetical protein